MKRTRAKRPAAQAASSADRIEAERRKLQRASAVLACAAVAFDAGVNVDYSDAMTTARELVDAAVAALDSVALARITPSR